jgi:hypothetical protein
MKKEFGYFLNNLNIIINYLAAIYKIKLSNVLNELIFKYNHECFIKNSG